MSFQTSRVAIQEVLKTYTGAPKLFAENQPVPVAEQKVPWVRWSIRPAVSMDVEVGAKVQRVFGMLYFQHFTPEDKGTLAATVFATKIEGFLSHKVVASTAGAVTFQRAQLKYVGQDQQGFVQHSITIEYREDATAVNAS